MSGDADFGLCAPKAKFLWIRAEHSHLVLAFVSLDLPTRAPLPSSPRPRTPAVSEIEVELDIRLQYFQIYAALAVGIQCYWTVPTNTGVQSERKTSCNV